MMENYQLCLFEKKRNIYNVSVLDYMVFQDSNIFSFGDYNFITGPNGSGKSCLSKAIYASLGLGELRWYDLSWFAEFGKDMCIEGSFSTGLGKRKRHYRDKPVNYFGVMKDKMGKVDLKTYKACVGLYECQRTLFYEISRNFVNESTPKKRLKVLSKLFAKFGIDTEKLVDEANSYLKSNMQYFKLSMKIDKLGLHIYRNEQEHPRYSSGMTAVIRTVLILSAASQQEFPPLIFDDDFGIYAFDCDTSRCFVSLCKEYHGQIFIFAHDGEKTLKNTAQEMGYNIFNLELKERDMDSVSMKLKTRAYVADTDKRLESKIKLSQELLFNALQGKQNPVVCWSGGMDSTVALHLAMTSGLLKPVRILRSDSRNEYPPQYTYNKAMEKLWADAISYDIPVYENGVFTNNYVNGLIKSEMTIWEIIEKYGFPLLPKNFRPCDYPYYDAVMKYCHISVNQCCKELKEKPAKRLYSEAQVDLAIRGMTGGESYNRRRNIALGGYVRFVKEYNTYVADIIGFWNKENVIQYHNMFNIKWCDIYNMGIPRNGCACCFKSILSKDNSAKLLRLHFPKLWDHIMISKGGAKEVMKVAYIINKARAKGLTAGSPQLQLDDFDIEYLTHIDKYEEFDLKGIFAHQPCKCDNI